MDTATTIEVSAGIRERGIDITPFVERHRRGDWSDDEAVDNAWAMRHGNNLHATYALDDDDEISISSSPDHAITRVWLESERMPREIDLVGGYALWSEGYDSEKNPLIAIEEPHVERLLATVAIERALDVGTGTGRHALRLARRGIAVTGIDLSPDMLAVAQRSAEREGLTLDLRLGSVEDALPFAAGSFDLVVSGLMLSHVANLRLVIDEFFRVLRPGGFLLATDFHPDVVAQGWRAEMRHNGAIYWLPNPGATRADYLRALEAAGFTTLDTVDAPLSDAPDAYIPATLRRDFGTKPFCLVLWAQKSVMSRGAPV